MFLRIHLVKYSHRMHAKAGCLTPNIECRTNQTVLLHKFIAKMASNLPCVQKFRNKFLPDTIPDVVAYSFSNINLHSQTRTITLHSRNRTSIFTDETAHQFAQSEPNKLRDSRLDGVHKLECVNLN